MDNVDNVIRLPCDSFEAAHGHGLSGSLPEPLVEPGLERGLLPGIDPVYVPVLPVTPTPHKHTQTVSLDRGTL